MKKKKSYYKVKNITSKTLFLGSEKRGEKVRGTKRKDKKRGKEEEMGEVERK